MAKARPPTYGQVGLPRSHRSRPGTPAAAGRTRRLLLLLISLLLAFAHTLPAAGDELALGASVTIVASTDETYGARLADTHRALFGERALGRPDGQGAILLNGGRLEIELANAVTACRGVDVWATQTGWGKAGFTIHASADGRGWRRLGAGEAADDPPPLELVGDCGRVRYLRLSRTGGWLAVLLVDAVGAKGVIGE